MTDATAIMAAAKMSLPDGRVLNVYEFGDPSGRPVLFMHGGGAGATGLFAAACDQAARQQRIRLLAPDRPGLGESSSQPRRSVLDWPRDVGELAESLHLDAFDIVSHSGGAAYALACASLLPERILSVHLVSATASKPLILSREQRSIKTKVSMCLNASMRDRTLAAMFRRVETGLERDPGKAFQSFLRRLPACEQRSLATPAIEDALRRCTVAALRQGSAGVIADLRLIFGDWGFPLESVRAPVTMWHGECDSVSPLPVAHMLASKLPHSDLRTLPNEGHLSVWLNRSPDILASI